MAWENAGFEPRDVIAHLFGSGFPKSLNIHKKDNRCPEGWGTALKPAREDWWLMRKPLSEKTVALNVLKWGTGGINIDGSRVGVDDKEKKSFAKEWDRDQSKSAEKGGVAMNKGLMAKDLNEFRPTGRYPSNLIHDGSPEVVSGFPNSKSAGEYKKDKLNTFKPDKAMFALGYQTNKYAGDSGSAARFFYCAKSSRAERNKGLEGFEEKQQDPSRKEGNPGGDNPRNRGVKKVTNFHPTVKPIALMRYLVKLVTPPKGTVLDPFLGSGTTAIAAKLEGFDCIGIEMDKDYCKIAEARIKVWYKLEGLYD